MTVDQLRIMCPSLNCRRVLAVPASSRGKNVRCKNCGATIRVPEKQVAAPTPAAAPAEKPAEGAETKAA